MQVDSFLYKHTTKQTGRLKPYSYVNLPQSESPLPLSHLNARAGTGYYMRRKRPIGLDVQFAQMKMDYLLPGSTRWS